MGRIMAIDYGTRRVGIAITDPLQIIASPVTTIEPSTLVSFIRQYQVDDELDKIVVGYPLKEDGTPTHITSDVDNLLTLLRGTFPEIEFIRHDERYTSKFAMQSMITGGSRKKSRRKKSNLDQISATLILQSYMEETNLIP
jgi:putative Holliday junction resolvase